LKNGIRDRSSDVNGRFLLLQTCLTFCNHTLIENFSADFDFIFSIKP
jgi:hypothetical protein